VEIGDYLRAIRRRIWILILVPVLAAAVVAALLALQPPKYRAVATVAAPALVGGSAENQYSGPTGARAFVANFSAALTAPQVVSKVAEQTGGSEKAIREDLSAQAIDESSLIQVTFVSTRKAQSAAVATAASSETIKFLFDSQVLLARKSLTTGQKAVTDADKKITDFTQKYGYVNPAQTYQLTEQNILSLRQRQLDAQSEGNTTTAANYGTAIKQQEALLDKLAPLVASYRSLAEQKDQAVARRNDLARSLQQLQSQSRAADPRLVVTVSDPEQLSRLTAVIRQGGVAFAAGLFLAIALVVMLELVRRPAGQATGALARMPAGPELERYPVVGHLPWSRALDRAAPNVLADPALVRAGERLVANLGNELGGQVHGMFVVTSPAGSHGKTVVSTVLSTLLGRTGHHVLLVGTHRDYSLDSHGSSNGNGRGPADRWVGEDDGTPRSWVTALWALEEGLWVLPAWPDKKGGLPSDARLAEILNEARNLFDIVIVDSPPNLGRDALSMLTWVADGVLMVVSNADGAASMRRSTQSILHGLSASFVGLVVNHRIKGGRSDLVRKTPELPSRSGR
jgi:Mrp family chromosome partitioning ATPase